MNPPSPPRSPWAAVGEGLYLVVQRAEVLKASKAGVGQADEDGEQHDQEVEQGGGGHRTWGQKDASLGGGGEGAATGPHPAEEEGPPWRRSRV